MNYETLVGVARIEKLQKALGAKIWPEFMQHDETVNKHWPELYTNFLRFQFALLERDEVVGIGNSLPLNWRRSFAELPDSGLDWAMAKACADRRLGLDANLLIGIEILIDEKFQGRGISVDLLGIMKELARTNGMTHLALPVRPTLKCAFPLIPISEYVNWQDDRGLLFDPWLRVHIKAGGKIVGVCLSSMDISGTVSEWEKWTGQVFPGSGDFIVEKALVPVRIDRGKKYGSYIEPNVWVVHEIE
jgi:GNAT superfamily N-acetyltransferase